MLHLQRKATQHEGAEDVLAEKYDITAYFPIMFAAEETIQVFQTQMDEHGGTSPLSLPNKAVGKRGGQ